MTVRIVLLLLVAMFLAACSGAGDAGDATPSAAEQAQAQELLRNYDQARADENWEVAEASADQLRSKFAASAAAQKADATLADTRAHAERMRQVRRLRGLWDYQAVAVEGGTQRSAAIYSKTVAVEEGEPLPQPDAQLVLRDHPAWGRSAYLVLQGGDFDCYRGCRLPITLDGKPAKSLPGSRPDTDEAIAMFIEDERALWKMAQGAKTLEIEFPVKGLGKRSAVFEVAGLDPTRMPGW